MTAPTSLEHLAVDRLADALSDLMVTLAQFPGSVQTDEFRDLCDAALRLAVVSQLALDEAAS